MLLNVTDEHVKKIVIGKKKMFKSKIPAQDLTKVEFANGDPNNLSFPTLALLRSGVRGKLQIEHNNPNRGSYIYTMEISYTKST